jgi:predicted ABC-type ATPase
VSTPTPRKPDNPVLWIVAGPNGSGKSSLYNRTDIEGWGGSVWIINPDLLTQQIVDQEGLKLYQANLTAVQRIQRWLDTSIDAYQTIGVETVLSSSKYRNLVQWARLRGFQVRMIYVLLRSAALQIERVRIRVSEGGHDVAEEKIVSRRQRSFEELSWFVRHVDQCHIYDNSTGSPTLIAERIEDLDGIKLLCWEALPIDLREILKSAEIPLLVYTPSES